MKPLRDELAVSQVVSVILLVAVTAGLAAGTAVIAHSASEKDPKRSPDVGLVVNEGQQTARVARATWVVGELRWEDLTVNGCDTTGLSGPVQAGQVMRSCSGTLTVYHEPSNSLLFDYRFNS